MTESSQALLPPIEERPLVTFALFAYNQEKYIREAVEGALAQTYEPLEIIISDDCSNDKTFEIANKIVARYNGPHSLIINKNRKNLGIGQHIREVIQKATGQIIIMAAGDDISYPERTSFTVNSFFSDKDIFAVFGDLQLINEDGEVINVHSSRWSEKKLIDIPVLIGNGGGVGTGASYAYRRQCFEWPWMLPDFIVSEDRLLPFRAACLGQVKYIPNVLVRYRILNNSLSSVLFSTGRLAITNKIHLDELNRTIEAGLLQNKIPHSDAKIALRMIRELPLYSRLLTYLKDKKGMGYKFLIKVVDNWFHRNTILSRLKRKMS